MTRNAVVRMCRPGEGDETINQYGGMNRHHLGSMLVLVNWERRFVSFGQTEQNTPNDCQQRPQLSFKYLSGRCHREQQVRSRFIRFSPSPLRLACLSPTGQTAGPEVERK